MYYVYLVSRYRVSRPLPPLFPTPPSSPAHLLLRRRRAVQATMLELRMAKGSLFEKVLEAILDLVNVANVDCSSNGLSLEALHTEDVAILSIFFPSKVFQS